MDAGGHPAGVPGGAAVRLLPGLLRGLQGRREGEGEKEGGGRGEAGEGA